MAASIYTKLTGRNRSIAGFTQLWIAPDHLLLVKSSRLVEEYKRFSLADIQSIVITEMPGNIALQIIMIVAALAWMALWFAVDSKAAKWAIEITGVLGLLVPIIDIARGRRCRCFLHTRVTTEKLAPVSRTRIARNVLASIRPRIEAGQGVLPAEAMAQTQAAVWEPPAPDLAGKPGYIPEILCGLFLMNSAVIWATIQYPKAVDLQSGLINTLMAEVVLIVVALVRRKGRDERIVVYVVIVLAILGIASDALTFTRGVTAWYMTVLEKAKHNDHSITPIFLFAGQSHGQKIAAAWRAAAGVIGLAAAFWERRI